VLFWAVIAVLMATVGGALIGSWYVDRIRRDPRTLGRPRFYKLPSETEPAGLSVETAGQFYR
jgi:hypothetical protein